MDPKELVSSPQHEQRALAELPEKQWWNSKTYWLNIAAAALNILTLGTLVILALQEQEFVKQYPEFIKYLSFALGALNTAIAVANTILRWGGNLPLTKMMTGAAMLLALLLAGSALAGETAVMIDDSTPGTYILTVGANGDVAVAPVRVVRPGPAPPSPTPHPDIPPTPNLNSTALAAKAAAEKVTGDSKRTETATKLSVLYTEIAKRVKAGDIKGQESIAFVVKSGADMVLVQQGGNATAAWAPFRNDTLNSYWIKLAQEGAGDIRYATLLEDMAAGLTASVPNNQMQAMDLRQILEMIKIIIDMILKLFPNQGGLLRQ